MPTSHALALCLLAFRGPALQAGDAFIPGTRVATQLEEGLAARLGQKEALVWPLRHSGVAVRTCHYLLVFDFVQEETDRPTLAEGLISPADLRGQRVVAFVSHQHGDHFDRRIFAWAKEAKQITYVLTERIRQTPRLQRIERELPLAAIVSVDPDQQRTLFEKEAPIRIHTSGSTDDGVAYWVEVDGLTLLHAGDLALWGWEDAKYEAQRVAFLKQIEKFKAFKRPLDLAFLVADLRAKGKGELTGAPLAVEVLRPACVVPIHNHEKNDEAARKLRERLADKWPQTRIPAIQLGRPFYYSAVAERPPDSAPAR